MSLPPPRRQSLPPPRRSPVDKTGLRVPQNLLAAWERRGEVQDFVFTLKALGKAVEKMKADQFYARVSFNSTLSHLAQAAADIAVAKPAYVCPVCGGNPEVSKVCNLCKGIGLLSEFHWQTVSVELKEMRKIAVDKQK